jgi:hypothetical protein
VAAGQSAPQAAPRAHQQPPAGNPGLTRPCTCRAPQFLFPVFGSRFHAAEWVRVAAPVPRGARSGSRRPAGASRLLVCSFQGAVPQAYTYLSTLHFFIPAIMAPPGRRSWEARPPVRSACLTHQGLHARRLQAAPTALACSSFRPAYHRCLLANLLPRPVGVGGCGLARAEQRRVDRPGASSCRRPDLVLGLGTGLRLGLLMGGSGSWDYNRSMPHMTAALQPAGSQRRLARVRSARLTGGGSRPRRRVLPARGAVCWGCACTRAWPQGAPRAAACTLGVQRLSLRQAEAPRLMAHELGGARLSQCDTRLGQRPAAAERAGKPCSEAEQPCGRMLPQPAAA